MNWSKLGLLLCCLALGQARVFEIKFDASEENTIELENEAVGYAVQDTTCPDQQTYCQGDTTCCKLSNGEYGCCPMPNAVCCDDHDSCCPENTQCDVPNQTCIKEVTSKLS